MTLFAFIGHDNTRDPSLRPTHRPAHLAGLETLDSEGRLQFAGPLLGRDGTPVGSLVLFRATDLDTAQRFAESDAYVRNGVFASYEVYEAKAVFPKTNA